MNEYASVRIKHRQAQDEWVCAIDRAIMAAEAAEFDLSRQGGHDPSLQRKATGSYYTPSDVAGHFWDLFFRHNRIHDLGSLLTFIASTDLVEPAAGSGMFVFSFLKKAALLGATPESLAGVRFHVVDVNLMALRFFSERLREVESALGIHFTCIGPAQSDFLVWAKTTNKSNVVFAGNPPFVTNPRGSRWRNLYADFLEAMIDYEGVKGVSLILPLSICFSRDYTTLREAIWSAGMGISASSYDNIPDCLFKAGKPDSNNTNRANSQRCTILNLGGPDPSVREASALQAWSAAERARRLSDIPAFHRFSEDDVTGQIPRPESEKLLNYMRGAAGAQPLRAFLSNAGRVAFAVGGVARNYIGIRDYCASAPGSIPIKVASDDASALVLQVLSSNLFYDYWRTYGDGFHVTVNLIENFPVTAALAEHCLRNQGMAHQIWMDRAAYAKEKLNSGRVVRSYDFRPALDNAWAR